MHIAGSASLSSQVAGRSSNAELMARRCVARAHSPALAADAQPQNTSGGRACPPVMRPPRRPLGMGDDTTRSCTGPCVHTTLCSQGLSVHSGWLPLLHTTSSARAPSRVPGHSTERRRGHSRALSRPTRDLERAPSRALDGAPSRALEGPTRDLERAPSRAHLLRHLRSRARPAQLPQRRPGRGRARQQWQRARQRRRGRPRRRWRQVRPARALYSRLGNLPRRTCGEERAPW